MFGKTEKCPKCGKVKNVIRDFGTFTLEGIEYKQSMCKLCKRKYQKAKRTRK